MDLKKITIEYISYDSKNEMCEEDQMLVEAALEAQKTAYTPYSHFDVGAALLLDNGEIVKGSNQENMAFPSGLCAERTALFSAGANFPKVGIKSLAVVAGPSGTICKTPASPCGACRQVMAEYQSLSGHKMNIILIGESAIYKFKQVDDILPFIFDSL